MQIAVKENYSMLPHQARIIGITPIDRKEKTVGANFIKIESMVQVGTSQDQACH